MIEVIIRIIPYGIESESRVITEKLYIWNTGGNIEIGEYEFCIAHDKANIDKITPKKVKGHKRIEGAWSLVHKCLRKYYDRKK